MNRGIDVWGVLPYIRKFNVVIWDCSFDMVGARDLWHSLSRMKCG